MSKRRVLRLRERGHSQPGRANENVVEVVRAGQVVATIYGSREGIHITSEVFGGHGEGLRALFFAVEDPPGSMPGIVIPILAPGEICPWCDDLKRVVLSNGPDQPCPVCGDAD